MTNAEKNVREDHHSTDHDRCGCHYKHVSGVGLIYHIYVVLGWDVGNNVNFCFHGEETSRLLRNERPLVINWYFLEERI
jgi:hypothetical protein